MHWVEQALARGPPGVEMLLVDDLNARLAQLQDWREEELTAAIDDYGIGCRNLLYVDS